MKIIDNECVVPVDDWDAVSGILTDHNFLMHDDELEWWFNRNSEEIIIGNRVSEIMVMKINNHVYLHNFSNTMSPVVQNMLNEILNLTMKEMV